MLGTKVGHTVKPNDAMEGETVGIEVNCGVGLNVGVNVASTVKYCRFGKGGMIGFDRVLAT